jgi:hypothetical protein
VTKKRYIKSRLHRSHSRTSHHRTTQKTHATMADSSSSTHSSPVADAIKIHIVLTVNLPLVMGLSPVTLQFFKQHIAMRHCSRIMSPVASSTFCKCLIFCNQCDTFNWFNWSNWKSAITFWCYHSPSRSYRQTAVKNTGHYSIRGHAIMETPHSRQYPNILPSCKYPLKVFADIANKS